MLGPEALILVLILSLELTTLPPELEGVRDTLQL